MLLNSAESNPSLVFWGKRSFEGVDFYIEPETNLPEICPFKKPDKKLICPHRGLNEKSYRPYYKQLFIAGTPDVEELFAKDLVINEGLTFLHASYIPNNLKRYLECTNAIPLVIYGLTTSHDFKRIFDIARQSIIRPVYIYGSGFIPVPSDFKEKNYD